MKHIINILTQPHINVSGLCNEIAVNRAQMANIIEGRSPMPAGVLFAVVGYLASSPHGLEVNGYRFSYDGGPAVFSENVVTRKEVIDMGNHLIYPVETNREVHDIMDLYIFFSELDKLEKGV